MADLADNEKEPELSHHDAKSLRRAAADLDRLERLEAAGEKALEKQAAADKLISYAITCRLHNQREWMAGLVEYVNKYAEVLDADERFKFDGDCIVKFSAALNPTTTNDTGA